MDRPSAKADNEKLIDAVRRCYSTWGETYYADYCGPKASYPPVHYGLLQQLLRDAGAKNVLDVGCGPASFLREIPELGSGRFGFDLTPEMIAEAKKVLGAQNVPAEQLWIGNVLDPDSFICPVPDRPKKFDAVVCVGVMPHIPAVEDETLLKNLHTAAAPGGLVALEARNQFFSLFTLNRYSFEFFANDLIGLDRLLQTEEFANSDHATVRQELAERFRMDQPPIRAGSGSTPGYDEVLSRTHNPLLLAEQFRNAGFSDVRTLFYHFHCLPPFLAGHAKDAFTALSLAQEDPADWRGYFMASAFFVIGKKQ